MSRSSNLAVAFSGVLLIWFQSALGADTIVRPADELNSRISSTSDLKPADGNLFGEEFNDYSGTVRFSVTDVSLPGNSALPVEIRRYFDWKEAFAKKEKPRNNGIFGDWEWDVPHLHGLFRAATQGVTIDWPAADESGARCNQTSVAMAAPPAVSGLASDDPWHGNQLYLPGQGDSEMLLLGTTPAQKPNDGQTYRWATKSDWYFSCLPTTANGAPGEAFLARAPDGTKYWFDQFASRLGPTLSITGATVVRNDVWIMPTRVEDQFGNWVKYTYDANDPWRVTKIESNDGRVITVTYVNIGATNKHIASISDGTRTWTYDFDNGTFAYPLHRVWLPDGSHWTYVTGGLFGSDQTVVSGSACGMPGSVTTLDQSYIIHHPSGATARYYWNYRQEGRTNVPKVCGSTPYDSWDRKPAFFNVLTMTRKEVSGPGLGTTPLTWTWTYSPFVYKYTTDCTSGCATDKWTTVTQPDGTGIRSTYGVSYGGNEGLLLKQETLAIDGSVVQTRTFEYQTSAAGQAYTARNGSPIQPNGDPSTGLRRPLRRMSTTLQGATATMQVSNSGSVYSFDAFARPTQTVNSSTGSAGGNFTRTVGTSYFDDTAHWILGQLASSTLNAKETQRIEYSALAKPTKVYRSGLLVTTSAYNPDGTVASITDGRSYKTTFTGWKRGVPGTIGYPTGKSKSAVINSLGLLTTVTNEAGFSSTYAYDSMGRLSGLTYPVGDTTSWNSSSRVVVTDVGSIEYGIDALHWKVIDTTGSKTVTTYLDGLFRPVLVSTQDSGNPASTSFVLHRFDGLSREVFTSYPVTSLTSVNDTLPGTKTSYDALGRPTSVGNDSEKGVLTTSYQYLPGFLTRVTDPRNYVTETKYQIFDKFISDSPVEIVEAKGRTEQRTTTISRDSYGRPLTVSKSGVSP